MGDDYQHIDDREEHVHQILESKNDEIVDGEEDCDDFLGTEEFKIESPSKHNIHAYQDSPGMQILKLEG